MKNQIKWIAGAALFVVLIAASVVAYRQLSARVRPDDAATTAQTIYTQTTAVPETELSVPVTKRADETPDATERADTAEPTVTTPAPTTPAPTTPAPTEPTQPALAPAADRAADFTVLDANGQKTSLSSHFGKPVVVNFWASWCGPCRSELPAFDAAAKRYDGKIDFMMVNLTDGYSETQEDVREFIEDSGYTFPVYYDTEESGANAYSVYSIPLTVFIRADGTVMDSHVGAMSESVLQGYLDRLTA